MCGSAAFGQGSFQLGEVVAHEVKSDQHGGQHLFRLYPHTSLGLVRRCAAELLQIRSGRSKKCPRSNRKGLRSPPAARRVKKAYAANRKKSVALQQQERETPAGG